MNMKCIHALSYLSVDQTNSLYKVLKSMYLKIAKDFQTIPHHFQQILTILKFPKLGIN